MESPIEERRIKHGGNAALRSAFPTLVAEWQAYWEQQPWHRASDNARPDTIVEVLRAVLDTAMAEERNPALHERLLRTALSHGEQRRRQGATDEAVLGDYHALRSALWRHVLHQGPIAESLTTIFRVDVVMTAASALALRGFMHGHVSADFPWERQLARTMAEVSHNLEMALD